MWHLSTSQTLKVMQWSFEEKINAVELRGLAAVGSPPIEYQMEEGSALLIFAGKNSQNYY